MKDPFLVVNICILFLFSLLGYLEARRLASHHKDLNLETLHHKARYIYLIIAVVILAIIAIGIPMMNRNLLWEVPLWFDLYCIPFSFSIVIGSFSFLFTLTSVVSVLTHHKESKGILVASSLIIIMFPIFQYQYTHPVYPQLVDKKINFSLMMLQSHPSTCAAASGANIANVLGLKKTEKEMARLMNTSDILGTSAGQVINGMAQIGITCSKKWVKDSNAEKISAPAMFFVDNETLGPESHAVAFMGLQDGKSEIWDPLEGMFLYPAEKLKKVWHGKSLECSLAG